VWVIGVGDRCDFLDGIETTLAPSAQVIYMCVCALSLRERERNSPPHHTRVPCLHTPSLPHHTRAPCLHTPSPYIYIYIYVYIYLKLCLTLTLTLTLTLICSSCGVVMLGALLPYKEGATIPC